MVDQHAHWQREQEEGRTVMQHHIRDKGPIGPKWVDGERQEIDWVSVQMETDRVTA
jgi:hypothetical protein